MSAAYEFESQEEFDEFYTVANRIASGTFEEFGLDVSLGPKEVDTLLYNADMADNPEDVYNTVVEHYKNAEELTCQDEIRLNKLHRYAQENGMDEVADEIDKIPSTSWGVEHSEFMDAVRHRSVRGSLRGLARDARQAGNTLLTFVDEANYLAANGYDGWEPPADETDY